MSVTFGKNPSTEIFKGKFETFLTCWKLAEHLREKILDDEVGKFFEESALRALYKTLFIGADISDLRLLFDELPNILKLNYPVVKDIRNACINMIPKVMNIYRVNNAWREFTESEYLLDMLKVLDSSSLQK